MLKEWIPDPFLTLFKTPKRKGAVTIGLLCVETFSSNGDRAFLPYNRAIILIHEKAYTEEVLA